MLDLYLKLLSVKHNSFGYYTKPKEKEITILIPCWGKANYIEETVKSCVNQTMKAYQIIVLLMDEDSIKLKDKLENLCDNVNCIIHERLNVSKARNYLVSICPTEYFFLLDADDTISFNALEECYKQKESVVQISKIYKGNNFGRIVEPCQQICFLNLTGLWHKEIWNELGGLNEKIINAEDIEFKLRVLEQKKWDVGLAYKANYNYDSETENNSKRSYKEMEDNLYLVFKDKNILNYTDNFIFNFNNIETILKALNNLNSSDAISFRGLEQEISCERKTIKIIFPKEIKPCYFEYISSFFYNLICLEDTKKINIILNNATNLPPFFQEQLYNFFKKNFGTIYIETDGKNKECFFYNKNDIVLIREYKKWNKNTNFDDLQKNEIPRLKITRRNISKVQSILEKNNLIYFNCSVDFKNKRLIRKLLFLNKKFSKLSLGKQCTGKILLLDFNKNIISSCLHSPLKKKIKIETGCELFNILFSKEKETCFLCKRKKFILDNNCKKYSDGYEEVFKTNV